MAPRCLAVLGAVVLAVAQATASAAAALPIVLMHGMGDFATSPLMERLQRRLSFHRNGTYVRSVALTGGPLPDIGAEYFTLMNDEVAAFARQVQADPKLAAGFHAIGFSQGALILRGYVERFDAPRVATFVSIHGPLAGVAGFPRCPYAVVVCRLFDHFLGDLAYTPIAQRTLAQANYLRDPKRIPEYLRSNPFLPDLNNELPVRNATYRANFITLTKLVLVKALRDTVVYPPESEWFGYYEDGSDTHVLPMLFTPWYLTDAFGLRTLDLMGRVFFDTTAGDHMEVTDAEILRLTDHYLT